jgi:hypothetical protein
MMEKLGLICSLQIVRRVAVSLHATRDSGTVLKKYFTQSVFKEKNFVPCRPYFYHTQLSLFRFMEFIKKTNQFIIVAANKYFSGQWYLSKTSRERWWY